jgi:hypothetical protein
MHLQHPHLSLVQMYAALAYYYEHQAEFEAEILRQAERTKAWATQQKISPYGSGSRSRACCHKFCDIN